MSHQKRRATHHQSESHHHTPIMKDSIEESQSTSVRFMETESGTSPHRWQQPQPQQQHHHHHGEHKHKDRYKTQDHSKSRKDTNERKSPNSRRRTSALSTDVHERYRRYLYSAISATFFFVLFRELGWIDHMQTTIEESQRLRQQQQQQRQQHHLQNGGMSSGASIHSLASAAANMAATSMQLGNLETGQGGASSGYGGTSTDQLLGNSQNYGSRNDMMEFVKQKDNSIVLGSRPIMYTFFEWIPPRNRGTSMSDGADKALIAEWKAAWKAAGWHPIVLTLEDSKKHPNYVDYAPKLSQIPMLGVDGVGGTIMYNQLCFLRWLAVAAAGGGFMSDYDVFPISSAPQMQQQQKNPLDPPYDGNFTVYCRIKHSKRAGIPCLMSGRADEWTRMAYALLDNGVKNAGTETMWSDMLALIDMRNDHAYNVFDAVLEGQEVLLKRDWTVADCNTTATKQAIHFSHEALKLGYLPPGETAEDRPTIVHRFLTTWRQLCASQLEEQEIVLGDVVVGT